MVIDGGGSPRLQSCAITGPSTFGLQIGGSPPSLPVISNCRWGDEGGTHAAELDASMFHFGYIDVFYSMALNTFSLSAGSMAAPFRAYLY